MPVFKSAVVQLTEAEILAELTVQGVADITGIAALYANTERTDADILIDVKIPQQTINDDVILNLAGAPWNGGGYLINAATSVAREDGVHAVDFNIVSA